MEKQVDKCPKDESHYIAYNAQYDAFWCTACNEWLNKICEDPNCHFCKDRPEKPRKVC